MREREREETVTQLVVAFATIWSPAQPMLLNNGKEGREARSPPLCL